MITLEQVTAEEARADAARKERDDAERQLTDSPHSELAAINLAELLKRSAQLASSARELRQAYTEQASAERAAADKETLEKAASAEIAVAGKAAEAARKALVQRVEDAQKALTAVMDGALSYSKVVAEHAAVLEGKGLNLAGGHHSQTGGGSNMQGTVLRLRGRDFETVDPGSLAVWLTQRVASARLPDLNPASGPLQFFPGVMRVQEQSDRLMAGLSQPKKIEWAPPPSLRHAPLYQGEGRS